MKKAYLFFVGVCAIASVVYSSNLHYVDMRIGTERSYGSNVLGPCLPHGSSHPSPDSKWPSFHVKPKGARHGFGPPTSGWWPGDKIIGFSQLHVQGTGGVPSYGNFRYCLLPSDMEIIEARPYVLRVKLKEAKLNVSVAPTSHGAIYQVTSFDGTPQVLPLNRRCKLAKEDCVNEQGEFTGNWNPAPYHCYAYEKSSPKTGIHRIAVSFKSEEQAKRYFNEELAGKNFDDIVDNANQKWDKVLFVIRLEGVSDEECRLFYSHLVQTFIQPRNRCDDGIGWDDHYTLWDTWRTLFPLMSIVDPSSFASNINSFADRFEKNGRCDSAYISGKDYKVGQGGDEADYLIAEAWAKRIDGIDWKRITPLVKSRWNGRTRGYREMGFVPKGEREDYCGRLKPGSATMSFAYQDWCCAEVLGGMGEKELSEKFRARSSNWTNIWDSAAFDEQSGIKGFVRGKSKDGCFLPTLPREGYNTDFYEANCWEYSLFVHHDIPRLIKQCGGKEKFIERITYALENKLIDFGNEPGFHIPWLLAVAGRPDLCTKWSREVMAMFKGDNLPGDNDSGAMSSFYIFLKLGFFPIGGQDVFVMHGSSYPKISIAVNDGKTFTIIAKNYSKDKFVKSVTLNGKKHSSVFLKYSEIMSGGELVFEYE